MALKLSWMTPSTQNSPNHLPELDYKDSFETLDTTSSASELTSFYQCSFSSPSSFWLFWVVPYNLASDLATAVCWLGACKAEQFWLSVLWLLLTPCIFWLYLLLVMPFLWNLVKPPVEVLASWNVIGLRLSLGSCHPCAALRSTDSVGWVVFFSTWSCRLSVLSEHTSMPARYWSHSILIRILEPSLLWIKGLPSN